MCTLIGWLVWSDAERRASTSSNPPQRDIEFRQDRPCPRVQDESDTPFVYWGIDTLFGLVPPNWGGGSDSLLSRDGFWYDRTGHDADGSPNVVIRYGYVGRRMLHSACVAAAAFAHGGNDLVIDEMLLTPDLLPLWMDALTGLDVQLVGVTCPLAVAEQREQDRRHPTGLARGHFHTGHDHGYTYDMTIDTTTGIPAALARTILRLQQCPAELSARIG